MALSTPTLHHTAPLAIDTSTTAVQSAVHRPEAVSISTASPAGLPSARIVVFKQLDPPRRRLLHRLHLVQLSARLSVPVPFSSPTLDGHTYTTHLKSLKLQRECPSALYRVPR
ncbi:hypothetical protein B0H16DRAFT_1725953 [Mycena metata]|uniref:Uncharacterized protein n=1 Tax=Mycena metata TaxID=1033252 RepID=A0AAD7IRV9_9AGAR|nr:hypothetical protein B0H16DRAFT_1725953 [Mycena metata]